MEWPNASGSTSAWHKRMDLPLARDNASSVAANAFGHRTSVKLAIAGIAAECDLSGHPVTAFYTPKALPRRKYQLSWLDTKPCAGIVDARACNEWVGRSESVGRRMNISRDHVLSMGMTEAK